MTQDEVSLLDDEEICRLSLSVVKFLHPYGNRLLEEYERHGVKWVPLHHIGQAMRIASLMDATISFGDRVVLVSERAGYQSRTVEYGDEGRLHAMRRAVTLLAADYAQNI